MGHDAPTANGYQQEEAKMERVSRRAGRRWMDELLANGLSTTHDTVMEIEGSRLRWWRTRRRLRRRYGVVATRVSAAEWRLYREA
jgi:hypothetical protein